MSFCLTYEQSCIFKKGLWPWMEGKYITFSVSVLVIKQIHYYNHLQYKCPTRHWYCLLLFHVCKWLFHTKHKYEFFYVFTQRLKTVGKKVLFNFFFLLFFSLLHVIKKNNNSTYWYVLPFFSMSILTYGIGI